MDFVTEEMMWELELEWRLTIATLGGDPSCREYLLNRYSVLLRAILTQAEEQREEPVEIFMRFRQGLHKRHLKIEEMTRVGGRLDDRVSVHVEERGED